MDKELLARIILKLIETQSFKDWYDTDFEGYIAGDEDAPSKDQIIKELVQLL